MTKGKFEKRINEASWIDDYLDEYCRLKDIKKIVDEARKEFPKQRIKYPEDSQGRKIAEYPPRYENPPPYEYEEWYKKWFGEESE